jgi:acetyl esterase/lipase
LKGDYALDDDRIGWFSPACAESLAGLTPAFIATGDLDLFVDEDIDYARRLV